MVSITQTSSNPAHGDDSTWYGYDCTSFNDYLAGRFYGRFVKDAWRDDPLYVTYVVRNEPMDAQTRALQAVYTSFVVAGHPYEGPETVVLPKLACDIIRREAGRNNNCIVEAPTEVDSSWQATPQQVASWFAGSELLARPDEFSTKPYGLVGETDTAVAIIEKLRERARAEGVNVNVACDAFAVLGSQAVEDENVTVDALIDVACAAVR